MSNTVPKSFKLTKFDIICLFNEQANFWEIHIENFPPLFKTQIEKGKLGPNEQRNPVRTEVKSKTHRSIEEAIQFLEGKVNQKISAGYHFEKEKPIIVKPPETKVSLLKRPAQSTLHSPGLITHKKVHKNPEEEDILTESIRDSSSNSAQEDERRDEMDYIDEGYMSNVTGISLFDNDEILPTALRQERKQKGQDNRTASRLPPNFKEGLVRKYILRKNSNTYRKLSRQSAGVSECESIIEDKLLGLDYRCLVRPLIWEQHGKDIAGWYMTQRQRGFRCFWDGTAMWSKNGTKYDTLSGFVKDFPDIPLDGMIYDIRGDLMKCLATIKKTQKVTPKRFTKLKFIVYDMPSRDKTQTFEERLKMLKELIPSNSNCIELAGYELCQDKDHLLNKLKTIRDSGGEGIFLKDPDSFYFSHHSKKGFLEINLEYEKVAVVTGVNTRLINGKPILESMHVKDKESNVEFKIWLGIPKEIKENPPSLKTEIKYKYSSMKTPKIPKSPLFLEIKKT